jgi:hypothetical protein
MEWFLINNINKHGHNVTKIPYAQFDHHECKIKLYRTKLKIVVTANPTHQKYLALQIALLYLSKHTYAHSARVLLPLKKMMRYMVNQGMEFEFVGTDIANVSIV